MKFTKGCLKLEKKIKVCGLGFGVWDFSLWFGIWNLEFGIWDLESGIWDLEFVPVTSGWNLEFSTKNRYLELPEFS